MEWIIQLPLLAFSISVHEAAHGWAAFLRGDRTAEEQGRLTLNPLAHVDAFGTVLLPLLCHALRLPMFGWAKPTPMDDSRLKRPRSERIEIAAAGPLANLVLALAMAVSFKAASLLPIDADFQRTILDALLFGVSINLLLAFFNLIPLHPLDGGQILAGFLPRAWQPAYARLAPYGFYALVPLVFSPALASMVLRPSTLVLSLLSRTGLIW